MSKGYGLIQERILYSRQREPSEAGDGTCENNLHPRGEFQERILNPIVPFMINYGPQWAERIAGTIDFSPRAGNQVLKLRKSSDRRGHRNNRFDLTSSSNVPRLLEAAAGSNHQVRGFSPIS